MIKNKKGFTLIELLATIVIIAIILLITVPLITNIISSVRKSAFKSSAYGIINAAEIETALSLLNIQKGEAISFEYINGIEQSSIEGKKLQYKGKKPKSGKVVINEFGDIAIALFNGVYCAEKWFNEQEVKISSNIDQTECTIQLNIIKPEIILNGEEIIYLKVGDVYIDPGATAIDDVDGDITDQIVVSGEVNVLKKGVYTVTYSVKDSSENKASIKRTVIVEDDIPPTIVFEPLGNDSWSKSHNINIKVTDLGGSILPSSLKYVLTTTNEKPDEDDFINSFVNNKVLKLFSETGKYYLWASACDDSNNCVVEKTNLFWFDNTKPVITLTGSSAMTIDKGSSWTEPGATANDEHSGVNNSDIVITGSVNPNIAGVYTLYYNVKDKAGNEATEVIRTVTVVDVKAPVITIKGDNPKTVYVDQVYNDEGATAIDDVDGDVTGSIVTTGSVTPSIPGTYYITYTVSDSAGNTSSKTRTVNVIDNVKPVVTFGTNGNSTYKKSHSTTVVVSDAHSGVNASSLKYLWNTSTSTPSESSIKTSFSSGNTISTPSGVTGNYYLWILAKDTAGNTEIKRSNVFKVDNTSPTITFGTNGNGTYKKSQSTTVTVSDGHSSVNASSLKYLWNTSTSTPSESSIKTSFSSGNTISTPSGVTGNYYLWILAKDTAGNTEIKRSNVFKLDNTNPTVSFGTNGNSTSKKSHSTTVTVSDTHSGVNASSLKYLWNTSTSTPSESSIKTSFSSGNTISTPSGVTGDYYLWILAKDTAGNSEIKRSNIFKVDNTSPTITFGTNGNSTYKKSQSTTVSVSDAHGTVSSRQYQWTTSSSFPTSGTWTNFSNGATISQSSGTGNYYLHIKAIDNAGNEAKLTSSVFKLDNTKPVITLTGSSAMTIDKGSSWTEPGATASDAHSGVNNSDIVITGSINPNIVGVYTLYYNVKDKAGNDATEVTRTVTVIDVKAPVITIKGDNPKTVYVDQVYNDEGATALDDVDGDVTGSIVTTGSVNTSVPGTYYITYTVSDSTGNTATAKRTVYVVDNVSPIISFGTNGNGIYKKSQSTTVSVSDAHGDVNTRQYQWTTSSSFPTGGTWTNFSNGGTITQSSRTGNYYLHIKATDNAGNEARKTTNVFKLDNTAPVISGMTISASSITDNGFTINRSGNASDAHSGLAPNPYRYQTSTNGSSWTTKSTTTATSYKVTGLSGYTNYYYRICVQDMSGNEACTSSKNVRTDLSEFQFLDVRDENVYDITQIGDQVWFTEGLRYDCSREGYTIATPGTSGWSASACGESLYSGGWSYGWVAAMNGSTAEGARGLCPTGWHIPSDNEWMILEGTLDRGFPVGSSVWDDFGPRGFDIGIILLTVFSEGEAWWTSSEGYGRHLIVGDYFVYREIYPLTSDFLVHCVKDL